jgi:hypothetical protein
LARSRLPGDFTAFDALIRYSDVQGRNGFVAFEIKYSESMREPDPALGFIQNDARCDKSGRSKIGATSKSYDPPLPEPLCDTKQCPAGNDAVEFPQTIWTTFERMESSLAIAKL